MPRRVKNWGRASGSVLDVETTKAFDRSLPGFSGDGENAFVRNPPQTHAAFSGSGRADGRDGVDPEPTRRTPEPIIVQPVLVGRRSRTFRRVSRSSAAVNAGLDSDASNKNSLPRPLFVRHPQRRRSQRVWSPRVRWCRRRSSLRSSRRSTPYLPQRARGGRASRLERRRAPSAARVAGAREPSRVLDPKSAAMSVCRRGVARERARRRRESRRRDRSRHDPRVRERRRRPSRGRSVGVASARRSGDHRSASLERANLAAENARA